MKIRVEFKLQDLWIGVYWEKGAATKARGHYNITVEQLNVWICLIPCFPIHIIKEGDK